MELKYIFERLWKDYSDQNPSVKNIYDLFINEGEEVVNDHIAFRTLDINKINIDVLAKPFTSAGYVPKESIFLKTSIFLQGILSIPSDKESKGIYKSAYSEGMFLIYSGNFQWFDDGTDPGIFSSKS